MICEVAIKLDKDLNYYENMLNKIGMQKVFSCQTHDQYWTNVDLNNLSEEEIKNRCVRYRIVDNAVGEFQNYQIFDVKSDHRFKCENSEHYIGLLESSGWKRVFDTFKSDYHYAKEGMTSRIQLQEIKDIGLVLYYDNPDYYHMSLNEQRKRLIDELNSYGFTFDYDIKDLEKLNTLLTLK